MPRLWSHSRARLRQVVAPHTKVGCSVLSRMCGHLGKHRRGNACTWTPLMQSALGQPAQINWPVIAWRLGASSTNACMLTRHEHERSPLLCHWLQFGNPFMARRSYLPTEVRLVGLPVCSHAGFELQGHQHLPSGAKQARLAPHLTTVWQRTEMPNPFHSTRAPQLKLAPALAQRCHAAAHLCIPNLCRCTGATSLPRS